MSSKILVGVHWNSHKKCWSVVNFKSRKTVGLLHSHRSSLSLSDVSFKVDLSKKRKSAEVGNKDRHTFIVGFLDVNSDGFIHKGNKIKYQPYNNVEPFKNSNGKSILGSELLFHSDGSVYIQKDHLIL